MAASREAIAQVSGPDSMAKPSASGDPSQSSNAAAPKKKKHRGGRNRKKNKRQSFTMSSNGTEEPTRDVEERRGMLEVPDRPEQSASFYRHRANSNTSLESEALLDHRDHGQLRARRLSSQQQSFTRASLPFARHRGSTNSGAAGFPRSRLAHASSAGIDEDDDEYTATDRTPLLSRTRERSKPQVSRTNSHRTPRRPSANSKASSRSRRTPLEGVGTRSYPPPEEDDYDVNNPPSVPTSPKFGSLEDLMLSEMHSNSDRGRDVIIDIDDRERRKSSSSPDMTRRRATVADIAERDVCFPVDVGLSEIGEEEEEETTYTRGSTRLSRRRTRTRQWPDLEILEEWSREEKEERTHQEHVRAKKINEPVLIGGRLRPGKTVWHREEDDAPFRFTYFNETFDGTIHARAISDLVQDGGSFKDLFVPDPPELSDDSEYDEADDDAFERSTVHSNPPMPLLDARLLNVQQQSQLSEQNQSDQQASDKPSPGGSKEPSRSNTPSYQNSHNPTPRPQKPKQYGPRPTFWLDVLQPTEMEMRVLSKAFNIHQLTTEDILMEEPREKVELFQNYYFVNYRSFEQDKEDDDYMEPVNFYAVVFREGVITFHHSMTPHPANVRRRIRQLNNFMSPSSDWISYAIIDDVTDAFQPLTSNIEREVDEIDDEILYLHQTSADNAEGNGAKNKPKKSQMGSEKGFSFWKWGSKSNNQADAGATKAEGEKTAAEGGGHMLRRVGECRKKVMGLYRLLGNKADVIKGFAKRCNENERWEVAPRSEIALYLGDIQDHLNTMTGNVTHYESLLSRAHSNYVAQINIRMTERAESNADVLGKLTVLGTIVLPMNIITGMWGMNVWVPGQEYENDLTWFWCITAGLILFGVTCFFVAKKVYGIV